MNRKFIIREREKIIIISNLYMMMRANKFAVKDRKQKKKERNKWMEMIKTQIIFEWEAITSKECF